MEKGFRVVRTITLRLTLLLHIIHTNTRLIIYFLSLWADELKKIFNRLFIYSRCILAMDASHWKGYEEIQSTLFYGLFATSLWVSCGQMRARWVENGIPLQQPSGWRIVATLKCSWKFSRVSFWYTQEVIRIFICLWPVKHFSKLCNWNSPIIFFIWFL